MVELIEHFDWASTPLGDRGSWPQSLRTIVDMMLSAGNAMCLMWGPERTFLYNDRYAPILGTRHPHALGLPIQTVWPDVWEDIAPLVERTFAGETLTFENTPLLMTRHGYSEETWWSFAYSPVRDETGQVAGLLNITNETTAQVIAQNSRDEAIARLSDSEQFLRSVLASSNDCIKVLDLDAKLVFMSEGGQRVMEVSDFNAINGCPWPDFWQGEGNAAARQAIASAQAGKPAVFQGYADTMKGTRRYWDVQVSPIFGADGKPERILSVSRDISALKASEEARAVLNQELAHRMKNLLSMVQAITAQTLRQARTIEEANEAVFTRISALARAQDILTRSNFEDADVREVVGAAMAPHQTEDHRIEANGPRLGLTAQQALGLSLAIHELATNAAKYGALSNETGRVAMSWAEVDGAFVFRWIETGGPPVIAPERRGFGSKLIERIVAAYFDGEGRIDFDPAGIRFTLTGAPARPDRIA
ncbi:sensor histidine kinase [Aureimonas ureilytica]|uniref:sensor histidine kinase n=1 Tax=Aureimonas ureilytica TaxID=401562 RepID=UPI00047622FA|nr:PAS domain-containing protein [Aureimonas ureilytica]